MGPRRRCARLPAPLSARARLANHYKDNQESMALDILLTVILTSVIQSIFGVGVLLFGTPLLLLFDYDFIYALTILLPISLAINAFQIAEHHPHIDTEFYKNILLYTIPFVILFLFLVTSSNINIGIIIGLFLLFVALKSYSKDVERALESMVKYEKPYFIVMGIVHGLTNLGGSLLTAIVHSKNYEKDVTRVTVAVAYATFALFQILTLAVAGKNMAINYSVNGIYLTLGLMIYIVTNAMVYVNIDNERYSTLFAFFLLVSGLLLIAKSAGAL